MFENLTRRSWILQRFSIAGTTFRDLVCNSPVSRGWCITVIVLMFIYCSGVTFFYHFFPDHSVLYFPLIAAFAFVLIGFLYSLLSSADPRKKRTVNTMLSSWYVFIVVALTHISYYLLTDGFKWIDSDILYQWQQIMTFQINDWHPLLHTCILWFFQFFTGSILYASIFFQIAFALCCAWCYHTLKIYHYRSWIIWGCIAYIAFSPLAFCMLSYLDKDIPFSISAFGCMIPVIHIWHTKGKWLYRFRNQLGFALLLLAATGLRYNGIFFVIPLLVFLPLLVQKQCRRYAYVLIGIVSVCILVFSVTLSILLKNDVIEKRYPDVSQTYLETIGIPMAVLIENYLNAPDKTDPAAIDFLDRLADREFYGANFNGHYNSVKFQMVQSLRVVLPQTPPLNLMKMFVNTAVHAPGFSLRTIQYGTHIGFAPLQHENARNLYSQINGATNLYGWYNPISQDYTAFCHAFMLRHFFAQPGMLLLLLVIFGTFGFLRHGWKILSVAIPLIAYGIGTTLLLCMWDFRFFYILFLCTPAVLLLCCNDPKHKEEDGLTSVP